ncbi:PREDICTED: lipase member M-like, partial [Wasmannia auropunctata]|uniref:lipase member M-like n=1 Tax=Wasmannia auropunctata TaxID=64793 RepID=UPI0005EDAD36
MYMKLISFIFMLTIMSLEGQVNFMGDLEFFRKAIVKYVFPKDPGIVRVRKPEETKTVNNVTTLDFIGLVERYGYPAEEHYVTTEDGYNLVIHRISGSPLSKSQQRRKVVFLQHAILVTSDAWVLLGPGKDLEKFQAYDYGYFDNYKQYGQITPITYDLKKVTTPLALFYGANDILAVKR